ncbi:MAG TPA: HmuY family protein [Edaphocola sp.]|nr:HmuY family protein [Edaphocola sp.]
MMKNLLLLLILPGFFLAACSPEELPAPKHEQGAALVNDAAMGENYEYQVFYGLRQNAVIAKNLKTDWDIAFENGDEGFHVILNSSKFMAAFNTHKAQMQAITDTSGFGKGLKYDKSDGDPDSTAIGDWRPEKPVYLIERGTDGNAHPIGFVKLQINAVDANGYDISFQSLSGGPEIHARIAKKEGYTYTYFSFDDNGKTVSVAPPDNEWDLCFTQYTVKIPIPYLVTGVLLNPRQTAAVMDSMISFDKIDLAYAQRKTFSGSEDVIGYDWKTYDFDAGSYTVDANMNYIIQTQDGAFYKLHFIDFYNSQGVKGYPKWEFSQL